MDKNNDNICKHNSEYKFYNGRYVKTIKPENPFDNPTEFESYNGDYSEIVPQISIEGCEIPYKPSKEEKSGIRHFYNIGGGIVILHFGLVMVISSILTVAVMIIMMIAGGFDLTDYKTLFTETIQKISVYISNSGSIIMGINLISYLAANLIVFFIGSKFLKIKPSGFFKTESFTPKNCVAYILVGLFIQQASGILISLLQSVLTNADLSNGSDIIDYNDPKAFVISACYACIVAPITEELLFRGVVLKSFSKVSQRFGIIMSAIIFGLVHGNVAQFALAFLTGLFMGYIAQKHNSLLPGIFVHFTVNFMATVSGFVMSKFEDDTIVSLIYMITVYGLLIAGIVMFILFCRKNEMPKETIYQKYRTTGIASTSPTTIIAVIIYLIVMVFQTFGS